MTWDCNCNVFIGWTACRPVEGCPQEITGVIQRCLRTDPRERPKIQEVFMVICGEAPPRRLLSN